MNKGDITEVNPKELNDIDVFVYSPPCQSFSVAGKQKGIKDPRGRLFYSALPIIQEKQPKYALMENVKGLTQKRFKGLFKDMLNELELAGYNNYHQVLNAKDYGIPQNRERVFIVSIRKDIDNGRFEFPEPFDSGLRLRDLLEDNVDNKYYINIDRFVDDINDKSIKKFNSSERTNNIVQLTYPKYSQQRIYSPNGISPTISAGSRGGGKEPTKMLFKQNTSKDIKICAQRGRYSQQGKIEQQIEIRKDENTNTLTTVQKDNLVIESISPNKLDFVGGIGSKDWAGDGKTLSRNYPQGNRIYDADGIACSQTSQGGGVGSYTGLYLEGEKQYDDLVTYKVRKLTPLESFRLMGFDDEDFDRARQSLMDTYYNGNDRANSQLYKQAGNSVVTRVIEEIYKILFREWLV